MSNPNNDSLESRFENAMKSYRELTASSSISEKESCIQDLKNVLYSLIQASLAEFLKIVGANTSDSIETKETLQLLTYFKSRYLEFEKILINICKAALHHAAGTKDDRFYAAIATISDTTFFDTTEQLINDLNLPSSEVCGNKFQSISNGMWGLRNIWLAFLHFNLPHLQDFMSQVKGISAHDS